MASKNQLLFIIQGFISLSGRAFATRPAAQDAPAVRRQCLDLKCRDACAPLKNFKLHMIRFRDSACCAASCRLTSRSAAQSFRDLAPYSNSVGMCPLAGSGPRSPLPVLEVCTSNFEGSDGTVLQDSVISSASRLLPISENGASRVATPTEPEMGAFTAGNRLRATLNGKTPTHLRPACSRDTSPGVIYLLCGSGMNATAKNIRTRRSTVPLGADLLYLAATPSSARSAKVDDKTRGCKAESRPATCTCESFSSNLLQTSLTTPRKVEKHDSDSSKQCAEARTPLLVGVCVGMSLLLVFAVVTVTWRRHVAKQRMLAAQQALERERKIENEFMSVTCHEVRNPLNGTVAYLQFALAALSRINTTGASAGGVQLSPAAQLPEGLSGSCSSRSSHGAADAADSVSDGLFEATQMAQGALACTTVALRVLENLTTLETLRQGSLTLTAAPEQLSDVLAEVKEGLAPQLAAASHGKATLRVALQPELQRRRVWCDRKMLLQDIVKRYARVHAKDCFDKFVPTRACHVLLPAHAKDPVVFASAAANLVEAIVLINIGHNAVRFTEDGFVEISARLEDASGAASSSDDNSGEVNSVQVERMKEVGYEPENGVLEQPKSSAVSAVEPGHGRCVVTFSVRDSGVGINEEQLAHSFDRFETTVGAGLAMYLTKWQLRQMGSEVRVSSPWTERHSGTEISFTLELRMDDPIMTDSLREDSLSNVAKDSVAELDSDSTTDSVVESIADSVGDLVAGTSTDSVATFTPDSTVNGDLAVGESAAKAASPPNLLTDSTLNLAAVLAANLAADTAASSLDGSPMDLVSVSTSEAGARWGAGATTPVPAPLPMIRNAATPPSGRMRAFEYLPSMRLLNDGARMLLVDDQATNLLIMQRTILKHVNHTSVIVKAATAEEALEIYYRQPPFDIIFIDEHYGSMARLLGSQAVVQMREHYQTRLAAYQSESLAHASSTGDPHKSVPRSPVIISCTGNALQEREHLMSCGMTGVWNKPYPPFLASARGTLPLFHASLLELCDRERRRDLLSPAGLDALKTLSCS